MFKNNILRKTLLLSGFLSVSAIPLTMTISCNEKEIEDIKNKFGDYISGFEEIFQDINFMEVSNPGENELNIPTSLTDVSIDQIDFSVFENSNDLNLICSTLGADALKTLFAAASTFDISYEVLPEPENTLVAINLTITNPNEIDSKYEFKIKVRNFKLNEKGEENIVEQGKIKILLDSSTTLNKNLNDLVTSGSGWDESSMSVVASEVVGTDWTLFDKAQIESYGFTSAFTSPIYQTTTIANTFVEYRIISTNTDFAIEFRIKYMDGEKELLLPDDNPVSTFYRKNFSKNNT